MEDIGDVIGGSRLQIEKDIEEFISLKIDEDCFCLENSIFSLRDYETTIKKSVEVSSIGTFNRKFTRNLKFYPSENSGWWFKRSDIPESKPIKVSYENAWTEAYGGVNNIVLGEKNSENIIRLTEHIIALKSFVGIDNLMIKIDSYDPPLFENGSLDILDALKSAGIKRTSTKKVYYSVEKKVVMGWDNRGFLQLEPPAKGFEDRLILDCAINYPNNGMGQQRIVIPGDSELTEKGVIARTNSSFSHALLSKTVGRFVPVVRTLGYNLKNVLVVNKNGYFNEPRLKNSEGKALEAVWHRAVLDLLAAVATIHDGGLVGKLTSYEPGHTQDLEFINRLVNKNLLIKIN